MENFVREPALYCLKRGQKFDVTGKLLLKSADETLRQLGAGPIVEWLSSEFPSVRNLRCDLLRRSANGRLIQLELQARNDPGMPLRMLDYGTASLHTYGECPKQILLYMGMQPLRMHSMLISGGIDYEYELVDIRDLNGRALLDSGKTSDQILAMLAGGKDSGTIREILGRLASLEVRDREDCVRALLILSELRDCTNRVQEEVEKMPLDIDISKNKVLGPVLREGMARGMEKGMEKGMTKVLRIQIEQRFGPLPAWAAGKLRGLSEARAEELAGAVLRAQSIEELFG